MSQEDEHRFASIESRLASMEIGMTKRDEQIASIINTLTRIEALLCGSMGRDGLVNQVNIHQQKIDSFSSKIAAASGFGAAIAILVDILFKK